MAIFSSCGFKQAIVVCLAACIVAVNSEESEIEKLPYCGPDNVNTQRLVFVSTLDGRLSALDADGSLNWSIETGPGPMLSSSIHRLELTNNGQWVRMIPSLSGWIYKFNGSNIEPVPVSADILLNSAPFAFSSELAMSGGKETRTYGVVAKTGRLVYECSMEGCTNSTDSVGAEDIILVQRQTQTVRAIEARSGIERWNFSVGQHDLNFVSENFNDCHGKRTPNNFPIDYDLKVIVPEGLICAVNKINGEIIWKHKFDSPVVAAWQLINDEMTSVDLFSGAQWTQSYDDQLGPISPTLYIGMHKRQLYIQESVTLHERVGKISTDLIPKVQDIPQIPWAPVPAAALAAVTVSDSTELRYADSELTTIASSFLYASEYVNGNGYYLFSTSNLKCDVSEKGNSTITDEIEEESNEPSDDYIENEWAFLLTYWKEIAACVFSCFLVFNIMFKEGVMRAMTVLPFTNREIVQQEVIIVEKAVPVVVEHENMHAHRSNSEPSPPSSQGYTSRFLTDFQPVYCLGKGGFGVVFEAKNKIDECHYAIKRIPLPNRQESRDRVMREVKALAKLDHRNIVRYFNAWLECPPPGWQEEQDKLVPQCDGFFSQGEPVSVDYTTNEQDEVNKSKPLPPCSSVFLNIGSDSESESLNKIKQIPRYNSEQSDSFIVFEDSGGKESELILDNENDSESENNLIENSTRTKSQANSETSDNCLSAWGEETKRKRTCSTAERHTEKKKLGHRRPKSLDISSGGGVVKPKVSRMYLFIQMQLCQRQSLREWLSKNSCNRSTSYAIHIFGQIVQAVEYVHLKGLIHRDLKPSNIFFSMNDEIKVGDFGLVTAMVETAVQRTPSPDFSDTICTDETHTARVGTQLYMSPEQAFGLPYNYKVDIYSLGIILFELLVPFNTLMERSCTLMDLRNNKFPQHFQEQFPQEYELLQLMLSHSPEERPTTFGIRARPPLNKDNIMTNEDTRWYFELPPLKREQSMTPSVSTSTSSSSESWEQM
ncbi:hypothetical protein L9F63_005540 [Diploptera punctata]|uniref:non-specific serine/threonine protein kinase n=1 Tax=Diploptera punctata TaxID=6984 RepID=A0AAD7ZCZ8_DIPPU|nr:hypothetical protein L9F63_005540 [Diploptera punctata]